MVWTGLIPPQAGGIATVHLPQPLLKTGAEGCGPPKGLVQLQGCRSFEGDLSMCDPAVSRGVHVQALPTRFPLLLELFFRANFTFWALFLHLQSLESWHSRGISVYLIFFLKRAFLDPSV